MWLQNSWHIPGRTFLNHPLCLFPVIHFDIAQRLSRAEIIWTLDTVLALLQGIYEATLSKPFKTHLVGLFLFLTKSQNKSYNVKRLLCSAQWIRRPLLRPIENNEHIYITSDSSFKVLVYQLHHLSFLGLFLSTNFFFWVMGHIFLCNLNV